MSGPPSQFVRVPPDSYWSGHGFVNTAHVCFLLDEWLYKLIRMVSHCNDQDLVPPGPGLYRSIAREHDEIPYMFFQKAFVHWLRAQPHLLTIHERVGPGAA